MKSEALVEFRTKRIIENLPRIEWQEIAPQDAQQMLKRNDRNRGHRPVTVNKYADAMAQGEWNPHECNPIKFGVDGRLIDGQHRLMALVKAGVTLPFIVASGVDDKAFEVMDTGQNRTAADAIQISVGVDKATASLVATGIRLWMVGSGENARPEPRHILAEYEGDRAAWDGAAESVFLLEKFALLPQSVGASLYGMAHKASEENARIADACLSRLYAGTGLEKGDPICAYRNWLTNKAAIPGNTIQVRTKLATLVATYNHCVKGRDLSIVKGTSILPQIVRA